MATKKPKPPKAQTIEVPEISYPQDETRSYDFYEPKPLAVAPSVDYQQGTTRDQIIDTLEAYQMPQLEKRSQLLDQYLAKDSTDWTDVLSEALLTIGPMIAGYAMDGNTGGVYGSQIGLNAGNTYRQQARADRELERYKTGQQLQQLDAEISAGEAMRQKYLDKGLDFGEQRMLKAEDRAFEQEQYQNRRGDKLEDAAALMGMRQQLGGGGSGKSSPEYQEYIRQQVLKIDPSAPMPSVAERQLSIPEIEKWKGLLPKQAAQGKPVPSPILEKFTAGRTAMQLIDEMEPLIDQLNAEGTGGVMQGLQAGDAGEWFADPTSAAYRLRSLQSMFQQQLAKQNQGGQISDRDQAMLKAFAVGTSYKESPESRRMMLAKARKYIAQKQEDNFMTYSAAGYPLDRLKEAYGDAEKQNMRNGTGAAVADSSGNGWLDRAESGELPISSNVPLKTYTVDELQRRGYSAAEIADLRRKGKVR